MVLLWIFQRRSIYYLQVSTGDHVSSGGISLGKVAFTVDDFKEPPVDGFLTTQLP